MWDDAVAVVKAVLRASLMVVHLEYAWVAWMVEQKGQYLAVKMVSHLGRIINRLGSGTVARFVSWHKIGLHCWLLRWLAIWLY